MSRHSHCGRTEKTNTQKIKHSSQSDGFCEAAIG